MRTEGHRDEEAVHRFVEHLAMTFAEFGFPRMPARVLGALMVADEDGLTAGQIGERLGVSAAAVSGAVRYLIQINVVVREPVRGSRRDQYRIPDDTWYMASAVKGGVYKKIGDLVQEGVLAIGDETSRAGARVAEMRDFFLFVQDELGGLLQKWDEVRRAKRLERAG